MITTGPLHITASVAEKAAEDDAFAKFVSKSLVRYLHEDWGEMDAHDKAENDRALKSNDGRIFAGYKFGEWAIWIITEADRSSTTILFPEEY